MTTESAAQRVARENAERWRPVEVSDVARSRRVMLAAYSCNRCGALFAITDRRSEVDTQLREDVDRLRAAIATHRQEQGEAVTKSAADAADRRLWKFLAAATQAGV